MNSVLAHSRDNAAVVCSLLQSVVSSLQPQGVESLYISEMLLRVVMSAVY